MEYQKWQDSTVTITDTAPSVLELQVKYHDNQLFIKETGNKGIIAIKAWNLSGQQLLESYPANGIDHTYFIPSQEKVLILSVQTQDQVSQYKLLQH